MIRLTICFKIIGVIFIISILSSCATIFSSSDYSLEVNSNPSGAKFKVKNRSGKEVCSGKTPSKCDVKANAGYFKKESYEILFPDHENSVNVDCKVDPWYWGNFFTGYLSPITFLVIDPLTGAMFQLETDKVNRNLPKIHNDIIYLKDGSEIKGKIIERVPNKSIKIKTSNGNIFNYEMDKIKKIETKD